MNANLQIISALLTVIAEQRNPDRLLREDEVAARLGISVRTLARWREDRRIGHIQAEASGAVLYKQEHVAEFIRANEIRPKATTRAPRVNGSNFLRR